MSFLDLFPAPKFLTFNATTVSLGDNIENLSKSGVNFVNVVLPDEKTYLFTAEIDKVPQEGINDAIAFILEENVPISLEESVSSYEVVHVKEGKIKVAVTVAPKKLTEELMGKFGSLGIMVISFDTESQMVSRRALEPNDRALYLLINRALGKTGFYIREEGVVQFSTTIPSALGNLREESDIEAKANEIISFWADKTGTTIKNIKYV